MKIFYHNFTKNIVNETERMDFIDEYEEDDIVYKSEAGNACLEKLEIDEIANLLSEYKEYNETF